MAYREHGMWEILDVLQRIHRGERRRAIARVTGRSRKTIARYVRVARALGWTKEPVDESLAAKVAAKLRPGPRELPPSELEAELLKLKPQLENWLKVDDPSKGGLTLTKVHELLNRQGRSISYIALYRFAKKHLGFARPKTTVRVADVAPGELAEVDFGCLGLLVDGESGRRRKLHALVVTLVHSRHQYVHLTFSQKLPDLIAGLEAAWKFFGGVPARVVVDNLKAAVIKADRYEPVFQRTFNDYAKHRGFIIDAAVARCATHKPHVERQVPYVRGNFFRGEVFLSLAHAQAEAVRWCNQVAGLRIHGTTRKQPRVVFETVENAALLPLSPEPFDFPTYADLSIHPDYHVRFDYATYSVPHRFFDSGARKVTLRADSRLVRIYVQGELVKTHMRKPPGSRSTDYQDYPEQKTSYALRNATYQIDKARKAGPFVGEFTESLLSGDFPWAHLRQAQKLLRLVDKYGGKRVDEACQRALRFDLINVHRVERILIQSLETTPTSEPRPSPSNIIQLPLRFLRDNQSFLGTPHRKDNHS